MPDKKSKVGKTSGEGSVSVTESAENVSETDIAILNYKDVTMDTDELLRAQFENSPDIILIIDTDYKILTINRVISGISSVDDVIGRNAIEVLPPNYQKAAEQAAERCFQTGEVQMLEHGTNGGKWVQTRIAPLKRNGKVTRLMIISTDITERRQYEKALRDSEERFHLLFQQAPLAFQSLDKNGHLIEVNDAWLEMLGYTRDDVIGKWFGDFLAPEYVKHFEKNFPRFKAAGETHDVRFEVMCKDGKQITVEFNGKIGYDESGQFRQTHCVMSNITERKQVEKALEESEYRYRTVVDFAYDWEYWIGPDGKYIYMSPSCERITGYSAEEFISDPGLLLSIAHTDDRRRITEHECYKIDSEEVHLLEFRIIDRWGKQRWIEHMCQAVRNSDGKYLGRRASNRDITNRKRMEEEILKMEKLETVGVLAGGIAHDFNNILGGVLGNISLAKMDVSLNSDLYDILDQAEKATVRAAGLTQRLLTFSKGGAPIKEKAPVADIIKDSAKFALSGSNIRCNFSFAENLRPVEVDKGQFSQVIQNLAINADQAMPEGGVINIMVENAVVGSDNPMLIAPGNYIKIGFRDHGIGIPSENLSKIFDPFFTTKPKGSGLGLASCYSIIDQHGGYIGAESIPGEGTTFTIYLLAEVTTQADEKSGQYSGKDEDADTAGLHGRVLVMDDEDVIRDMAAIAIARLGYEVEVTDDGGAAIELYKKNMESGTPFDIIIMDVTIPGGIGARQAIKELLIIDPDVRAIVSSGYHNNPIVARFKEYGFKANIIKPYDVNMLMKTLRRAMSQTVKN